jgi:uncharacterized protein
MNLLVECLVFPIALYKRFVSPLLPPLCRFHPSCSVYAMGALRLHGPFRGTWLTLRRLARCHPFGRSGFDPIPPKHGQSPEALPPSGTLLIEQHVPKP